MLGLGLDWDEANRNKRVIAGFLVKVVFVGLPGAVSYFGIVNAYGAMRHLMVATFCQGFLWVLLAVACLVCSTVAASMKFPDSPPSDTDES